MSDQHPTPGAFAIEHGMVVDGSDSERLGLALDLAFDYRGDVTLELRDGRRIEGYVFDRPRRPEPGVRILPRDSDLRELVLDRDVARLEVTGRDAAAGKTFENWVRRYVEKKRRGEAASIESESLDE